MAVGKNHISLTNDATHDLRHMVWRMSLAKGERVTQSEAVILAARLIQSMDGPALTEFVRNPPPPAPA